MHSNFDIHIYFLLLIYTYTNKYSRNSEPAYAILNYFKYFNNVTFKCLIKIPVAQSVSYRRSSAKLGSSGTVKGTSRWLYPWFRQRVVESDVGSWGLVLSTDGGWGIASTSHQHILRYVEWLIRWNNRLSSAASDGTDGCWEEGGGRPGVADWETA